MDLCIVFENEQMKSQAEELFVKIIEREEDMGCKIRKRRMNKNGERFYTFHNGKEIAMIKVYNYRSFENPYTRYIFVMQDYDNIPNILGNAKGFVVKNTIFSFYNLEDIKGESI